MDHKYHMLPGNRAEIIEDDEREAQATADEVQVPMEALALRDLSMLTKAQVDLLRRFLELPGPMQQAVVEAAKRQGHLSSFDVENPPASRVPQKREASREQR